ncbi:MAG: coiled-coil protein [Candidatus Heimdallarchaeaceae archaeon]
MIEESNDKLELDDFIVKLGRLEDQIKQLQFKRNEHNSLMKSSIKARNDYNRQVSTYLKKAKEYEEKRNKLNEEVQNLKEKRKELQQILSVKKKDLDHLIETESSVNKRNLNKQRYKMKTINEQIQKIEWNLQTQILNPEKEKELIQQAEKLSSQLNAIMETIKLSKQQAKLWKEVSTIQKEINQIHTAIIEMAKESQVFHKLMNQHYAKVNETRKIANKYHKDFIRHKKEGDIFHRELLAKYSEKNKIKEKLGKLKRIVREKHKKELQKNLEKNVKEAFKKYQNGVNLTLDEFRLLVDRGLI